MRNLVRCFLSALLLLIVSAPAFARPGVEIVIAPPALPVYEQPICPGDGYIWTPGYWAWDDVDQDYYWVPGTWVLAPEVGFLWTPGYWAWGGEGFIFNAGYWGPVVGFYGGIDYGFGYFGHGFVGGRWDHDHFFYNREFARIDVNVIHNVYNERVTNVVENRVSFNGGHGGVDARPTREEEAAARERHVGPVAAQEQHAQQARGNRELRASVNHGKPPIAATSRPGAFNDREAVAAKKAGGSYKPVNNRVETSRPEASRTETARPETRPSENNAPRTAVHPRDLPRAERPAAPNTGQAKLDKKYQQQQDKLQAQQEQERQKLQQKQDQEHQRQTQQRASEQQKQQLEQKHQQQTQHQAEQHAQQQQNLQRRQQSAPKSEPRH